MLPLVLVAILADVVHAQTETDTAAAPTSTSQIPQCVLTCLESALQSTNGACTSIVDSCVCTNTTYQQSAMACLTSKCSASDTAAAIQLENAVCGSSGFSISSSIATGSGASSAFSGATSAPSSSASSVSNFPSSHSSKIDGGEIAGIVIGCIIGGALISALLFWLYTNHRASRPHPGTLPQTSERRVADPHPLTELSAVPSPHTPAVPSAPSWTDTPPISLPPLADSLTPVQQVYQDALQKTYDSDDIHTSSTTPRFRDEGPRGLLPNTEHHWGQVGQYYADIPEL
ncbi:hypothetical protein F5887DRAFT_985365 [Amanita rubescens]|nr:hypothetical protein F5887DRAFT_1006818 [Amanita rubescens]KAF8337131.1 hypothetical protein F5887DRAFT_985365 [Amanita rubescens]